jgi:hypothetical protein
MLRYLEDLNNQLRKMRGGRNVDDQNVDRPKISERRNQNVENVFWVDQNYDDQNVENSI